MGTANGGNGNVTISMGTIAKAMAWIGNIILAGTVLIAGYKWCNSLSGDVAKMAYFTESIAENQRKTAASLEKVLEHDQERMEEHRAMTAFLNEIRTDQLRGEGNK